MTKPLILISNDDGITAPGIRKLIHTIKHLGEIVVVAPDSPQSGMGHAITVGNTIKLSKTDLFPNIEAYQCSGTPADCVKLAKHYVLKHRTIDLIVSGINHGSNSSVSVLYSGTMSAAIEGAMQGHPAIGFSLCDYQQHADMNHLDEFIHNITKQTIQKGLPKGIALNVNFPPICKHKIKGIKICRQAKAYWQEKFDERKDPYGRTYFWMVGNFINHDQGEDNDEWALKNNYVSIVPCQFDMTNHPAISYLNQNWDI